MRFYGAYLWCCDERRLDDLIDYGAADVVGNPATLTRTTISAVAR